MGELINPGDENENLRPNGKRRWPKRNKEEQRQKLWETLQEKANEIPSPAISVVKKEGVGSGEVQKQWWEDR